MAQPPSSRKCPNPPSAESLDLGTLIGSYYEIGSTARYKIRNELGMACTRTNFTVGNFNLNHGHSIPNEVSPYNRDLTINVSTSAVPVTTLDHHSLLAISRIASAASNICSNAARLCDMLSLHDGFLFEATLRLSTVSSEMLGRSNSTSSSSTRALAQVMELINSSVLAVQARLDRVARSVQAIAGINAALSQNSGGADSVDQLLHTLRVAVGNGIGEAREAGVFTINNLTYAVDMVDGVASHMQSEMPSTTTSSASASMVGILREASSYLSQGIESITNKVTAIEGLLNNIEGPLAYLVSAGTHDIIGNATNLATTNGNVSRVVLTSGQAYEVRPEERGNMIFHPIGGPETSARIIESGNPFKIIAVEGGVPATMGEYSAVLVYTCDINAENEPHTELFILSRTPTLVPQAITNLLDTAASYGLYTDCDSPFIPSVQRPADDCGATGPSIPNSISS
mgnify:CR=1 FL=1